MYAISLDFCKSFYDNGSSSSDQGYKNRSVFSKIVEKWQNLGSNLKTVENTVHCFKISEKDKNQQNICKKTRSNSKVTGEEFFVKLDRLG
jgi:hypothetical protein